MFKDMEKSKYFWKNNFKDHLIKISDREFFIKNVKQIHISNYKNLNIEKMNHDDMSSKGSGKIFGILTMPNGQRIRTMREDAFRAALAAIRPVRTGTRR